MKKELEYYLNVPYKIEIVRIPEDEGGGYLARLPQFGELGIVGDGNTVEEAIRDLEENKKLRFQEYLEKGFKIPEPEKDVDDFSGKFIVRMPKFLHRELALSARKNGVSLNQYVCTLLAMNFKSDKVAESLDAIYKGLKSLNEHVGELKYKSDLGKRTTRISTSAVQMKEYPKID